VSVLDHSTDPSLPTARRSGGVLDVDGLARRVVSVGAGLHWLVGAGVSLSAGVPTATDMLYGFKRTLYAQAARIDVDDLDPTDPDVRLRFDAYFATIGHRLPEPSSPQEYAVFFEQLHPTPADRQRAIARILEDSAPAPNLGHVVLALLWRLRLAQVVWTTNFDDVLEQSATLVSGAPRWLRRVDRTEPSTVRAVFDDPTKPVLVKLHGDYQSTRLDNTLGELGADSELRGGLAEAMRTKGLVVVGYSGRDTSILDALTTALDAEHPFPHGLYWAAKSGDSLLPAVVTLLDKATTRGVDARLVECPSFEELMVAIRRLLELDTDQRALLDRFQPHHRSTPFRPPPTESTRPWPKIRLNALAVTSHPDHARLLRCAIGATGEVRNAIADATIDRPDIEVVAVRRRDGVIAFGRDDHLLAVFAGWNPTLDHTCLDPTRSADLGLIYEGLLHALARELPLLRHGRRTLTVDPAQADHPHLDPLRAAGTAQLAGFIGDRPTRWAESIDLALEHRYGTLWLIYTPRVWHEPDLHDPAQRAARAWVRQRQAGRHNRAYTALLKAWADVLCTSKPRTRLHALADSGDAAFDLRRAAPYAERTTL
jgi:NAD-dependent SIR2 family protein deacetylase